MTTQPQVMQATDNDLPELWQLGQEGFGQTHDSLPKDLPPPCSESRTTFVIKEGSTILAKAVDRHFGSWWWHQVLPTAAVASVSVRSEQRGSGLLTPLLDTLLHNAHERGAVVSALFPSATALYRRFGFQSVTHLDTVSLPTQLLADVPAAPGRLERSEPGAPEVRRVYRRWAGRQNGLLDRDAAAYPMPEDRIGEATTVAYDGDDKPIGVARWSRRSSDGAPRTQHVHDMYATSPDGYRLLFRALGSSAMVTPTTTMVRSSCFELRTLLRGIHWQVRETAPYMLAILDVPAALTLRGWTTGIDVLLRFNAAGLPIEGHSGAYELEIANGQATCERIGEIDPALPCFTAGGFAQRYAGATSNANLRFTGGLSGPTDDDIVWDALFGGWQCQILDSY